MFDLLIFIALLCGGFFCAGVAVGSWNKYRNERDFYRMGRTAGFNDARKIPTLRP